MISLFNFSWCISNRDTDQYTYQYMTKQLNRLLRIFIKYTNQYFNSARSARPIPQSHQPIYSLVVR